MHDNAHNRPAIPTPYFGHPVARSPTSLSQVSVKSQRRLRGLGDASGCAEDETLPKRGRKRYGHLPCLLDPYQQQKIYCRIVKSYLPRSRSISLSRPARSYCGDIDSIPSSVKSSPTAPLTGRTVVHAWSLCDERCLESLHRCIKYQDYLCSA
jgi:hypothetical protein